MEVNVNINTVMNSGQIFSFEPYDDGYKIYSADKMCLAFPKNNKTEVLCGIQDEIYWKQYFNEEKFTKIKEQLRDEENEFIKKCFQYSDGMVILKQDLWEMIISYIVSQRNSIPAIKKVLFRLRRTFGNEQILTVGNQSYTYHTFPTANDFGDITLEKLQGLSLGYRDKYVLSAIDWYKNVYPTIQFQEMSRVEHMEALKKIKGVGEKVANCICLFALNDFDCFPIDVWIERVLKQGLISSEDIIKYHSNAGFLNQIIYYYVINNKPEFSS